MQRCIPISQVPDLKKCQLLGLGQCDDSTIARLQSLKVPNISLACHAFASDGTSPGHSSHQDPDEILVKELRELLNKLLVDSFSPELLELSPEATAEFYAKIEEDLKTVDSVGGKSALFKDKVFSHLISIHEAQPNPNDELINRLKFARAALTRNIDEFKLVLPRMVEHPLYHNYIVQVLSEQIGEVREAPAQERDPVFSFAAKALHALLFERSKAKIPCDPYVVSATAAIFAAILYSYKIECAEVPSPDKLIPNLANVTSSVGASLAKDLTGRITGDFGDFISCLRGTVDHCFLQFGKNNPGMRLTLKGYRLQ